MNTATSNWFEQYQKDALKKFERVGFPSRRDEDWKYSKISLLEEKRFLASLEKKNIAVGLADIVKKFEGWANNRIVFVNGYYAEAFSNLSECERYFLNFQEAVKNTPALLEKYLREEFNKGHGLLLLNSGHAKDGFVINIPDNCVIHEPIHVLNVNAPNNENMVCTRNLIVMGRNASATIIEHNVNFSDIEYFYNTVTYCLLQENAHLNYLKVQEENLNSFHFGHVAVEQSKNSQFSAKTFTLGGAWVRSDIHVRQVEEGASTELEGLFLGRQQQLIDHHTCIEHLKPYGSSVENYKGILDDRAHGVFNGKLIVEQHAQKISAAQSSKNILISKMAEMNTKPELQIYADDVKCAHGATVGQLDENSLFYLLSRGVSLQEAKQLLVQGFAAEILEDVEIDVLKNYVVNFIEKILSKKE